MPVTSRSGFCCTNPNPHKNMPRKSRKRNLIRIKPEDVVGNSRAMLKFFRLSRNTQGKTKLPITQFEMAKLMRCSDYTVLKIEREQPIDPKYVRQYWIALGFRFDQLIERPDGWTISDELFYKIVNKRGLIAEPAVRNTGKRYLSASAA